nr:MAG TPA: hypothetical protein [Caudoviricetes sp.]
MQWFRRSVQPFHTFFVGSIKGRNFAQKTIAAVRFRTA